MSHFSRVKTKIRDLHALAAAAEQMGLTLRKGGVVRGYFTNTQHADYVIKLDGDYDVGFIRQTDRTYELVADWYTGAVAEAIGENGGKLMQNYAIAMAIDEAKNQNYDITYEKLGDGTARITLVEPEFN